LRILETTSQTLTLNPDISPLTQRWRQKKSVDIAIFLLLKRGYGSMMLPSLIRLALRQTAGWILFVLYRYRFIVDVEPVEAIETKEPNHNERVEARFVFTRLFLFRAAQPDHHTLEYSQRYGACGVRGRKT